MNEAPPKYYSYSLSLHLKTKGELSEMAQGKTLESLKTNTNRTDILLSVFGSR
jgi:hypothetical protein